MAFILRVINVCEVRGLHIAFSNWNCLRDRFLFQFVSLRHILVGHASGHLCDRLTINTFSRTLVRFTLVILTWYEFASYSIVLPMSISTRVFHTLSIYFRCIIYVTV